MTTLEVKNPDQEDETDIDKTLLKVPNNIFFQKYIRRIPGKNTQSIKTFISEKHKHSLEQDKN